VPLDRASGVFRVPFRRLDEQSGLVIVIEAEARVLQQETWVSYVADADGDPFGRMNERVASAVGQRLEARRTEVEQGMLRDNPELANDRQALRDRVDAFLADHLADIIADAFDQLNAADFARETGTALAEDFAYRLVAARIEP
jgi:hypothetical protein